MFEKGIKVLLLFSTLTYGLVAIENKQNPQRCSPQITNIVRMERHI